MAGEAEILVGFGILIVLCGVTYMFYQMARIWKGIADEDMYVSTYQNCIVKKFALDKHKIDLDKEIAKQDIFKQKNFRNSLKTQILKEYFKEKE